MTLEVCYCLLLEAPHVILGRFLLGKFHAEKRQRIPPGGGLRSGNPPQNAGQIQVKELVLLMIHPTQAPLLGC